MSIINRITETKEGKNLLLHAVINQLEIDFDNNEFDSMDELITKLMENEANHEIFFSYLSDTEQEYWLEGKTNTRF